jgi:hypothetical protein
MTNIFDDDAEFATETNNASRSVKLTTGPTGVTYYLEPKYGHIRGIVCRRVDGTRIKCPDSLEGGFTDGKNALRAVEAYISTRGKAVPAPVAAPVTDFNMPSLVNRHPGAQVDVVAAAIDESLAIAKDLADNPIQLDEEAAPPVLGAPQVDVDDEEIVEEEPVAPVINLSSGKPNPDGETVTQKALRERLEGGATKAPEPEKPAPKPKPKRTPRSKQV